MVAGVITEERYQQSEINDDICRYLFSVEILLPVKGMNKGNSKRDFRIEKSYIMDNKKIGCVIAYKKNHTNYGTSLVGYALVKKIQQLGYNVEIINYVKKLSLIDKMRYTLNAYRCGELGKLIKLRMNKSTVSPSLLITSCLKQRIDAVEQYKKQKLYPLFHDYIGFNDLKNNSKNYKIIIVGSDQVWTPLSLPNKFFNLLFVDDSVKKVAYASSFGVSEIPDFQKKATGEYLDRFAYIGVREQHGKEIVDTLSHKKAQVVADPTLLLNRDEWEKEIDDSKVNETEPYIFCYFLGTNQDARKAVNELKAKTGLKIIAIRHMDEYVPEDENFGDEAPYSVDPNDFIKYISRAEYVCTDSFHCTAFSIQFHKKFMTFYRFATNNKTGRNSRIDSLFYTLQINKNHIYNGYISLINDPIDWSIVDKNLNDLRLDSLQFLLKSLK